MLPEAQRAEDRADIELVGIEQASARVREIQSMAASLRGAPVAAPAVDPAAQAQFAAALQANMTAPAGGAMLPPTGMPNAMGQLQAGNPALAVQAMLAGAAPAAPVAPAAPAAPSMLTGDLDGLDPTLKASLEQVAQSMGRKLDVVSGLRTHDEQKALYQKYLNGTGNLAAVPGTSRHESGRAADVYVDGVALADVPGGRQAAAAAGLGFPVPGEAWHVEPTR